MSLRCLGAGAARLSRHPRRFAPLPPPCSLSTRAETETLAEKNKRLALYMISVALGTLGVSYASVPLYKVFCAATGFGGTTQRVEVDSVRDMSPAVDGRVIKITFTADVNDVMPWKFKPQQQSVKVVPGETALAFYKATNPTANAITGVATYNVFPPKAGLYFSKIQCFCFEQQRLRAGEEIDMPVFFFIDKDILLDPAMDHVNNITLSYTFFKTEGDEEEELESVAPSVSETREASLKAPVQHTAQ